VVVSPLSVVPLKIGKNNCNPGETHRKTLPIGKIPTLDRVNLAEDRHQHSSGGLPLFYLAGGRRKRLMLTVLSDEQEKGYVYDPALAQFQCIIGVLKSFEHQCLEEDTRNDWSRILAFEITKEFPEWCS
jgi:hypothetical protein